MAKLRRGLYEELITEALDARLSAFDTDLAVVLRQRLHEEEAADRIALYLSRLVRRAISSLEPSKRPSSGADMAREIVALLRNHGRAIDAAEAPVTPGEVLQAIARLKPDGAPEAPVLPETPLLDTTLLTNAPGEPRIGHQIQSEIPSADRIDVLMAFVRRSGIRPLLDALRRHVDEGGRLRVLTTIYTGSTEESALTELEKIGAKIRVSYDTAVTRLHAKAWLFHRDSGYSTTYIGSSNLTHAAQISGLEWNVRVSGARNPDIVEKFAAVFESYWESGDFRSFDASEFRKHTQAETTKAQIYLSPIEIQPRPFQERLLEQLAIARQAGRHRNLLVAATGTGKTVMAALDYQRLRKILPRARLLFVAHRQEILEQSLATFRHALRDAAFGELWVGAHQPDRYEHVFASIQSLSSTGLKALDPEHFDVVIVDEFHHAAARTYEALLNHIAPRELLGLTATPERGDDEPILQWFGGHISAELRLWDAIDQQYLSPFAYYGISDGIDYRGVAWTRGRGYDQAELGNLVTGDTVLARKIIENVVNTVPEPEQMRALGFCVSVKHAKFMAEQFNAAQLPSVAVSAETPWDERRQALVDLNTGKLRAVFAVDLFNEGVDVPAVDTLLMLRPTDSATVFLQQLGRGLRRESGKALCTVLDFVGQHRKEFRFDRRFGALLGGTRRQLVSQIENGFPFLPGGCHMELDAVASKAILQNIKEGLPTTWQAKINELRQFAASGNAVTLKSFLNESGLALDDLYANHRGWSDLMEAAGLPVHPAGPNETALRRALGRLLHINDHVRINFYQQFSKCALAPTISIYECFKRRLFHMLASILLHSVRNELTDLDMAAKRLWEHPQVLAELDQLLEVLAERIDHLQVPLASHPEVPLCVHARYSRTEMLAAFGDGHTMHLMEWREGAKWIAEQAVDVLTITFDKTAKHFSPTTRYKDYAISQKLLHWESQSGTREESPTGRRYRQHRQLGSMVLPFARLSTDERAFWLLGPATYVKHEGECPMSIVWKLEQPLPGDLYAQFAAAVA